MIENPDYNFSKTGVEWIFEAMILINNFANEDYDEFKVRIVDHINLMLKNNEPNLIQYHDRLEDIFTKLEKINT
ncbi:hypothetical protein [Flammeovirga aprica]|uniref:Uncharacterized protein n=1 Tax=Flammeovirga aprica JL-4 TaxID=694437 RepID=A0A7X9X9N8_9BACT|nr:hypothetical protein [Flammeovirga aprica]NME68924.1 hypothetical protein [Flammeovirga aprica JL-4]